jgi:hypothetical protein
MLLGLSAHTAQKSSSQDDPLVILSILFFAEAKLPCTLHDLTGEYYVRHTLMMIAHDHIGSRNLFA